MKKRNNLHCISYECAQKRLAKCMHLSSCHHHSAGQKESLCAEQQWWTKRGVSARQTASPAPKTALTGQGCSRPAGSVRKRPSFSCKAVCPGQRTHPKMSLFPLWVHQAFHNFALQQGLAACPAQPCELSVQPAASFLLSDQTFHH